jgi:Polyketide cyclase / dehydrase and lipid transport
MAEIEERTVIAAPVDAVFDYRLDFASNLMACNPSVRAVVQTHGDGPGVGSAYRVRVRLAPALTTGATLTVTEAVRPLHVADLAESFLSAHEVVSFEPRLLPDGRVGTEVGFVVRTSPEGRWWRLLDAVVLPWLTRRQVRTELRRMRHDLESRARR